MPRSGRVAEIGVDVCPVAYVDFVLVVAEQRTQCDAARLHQAWRWASCPPERRRSSRRWLAKCGAAQTWPRAAPALLGGP